MQADFSYFPESKGISYKMGVAKRIKNDPSKLDPVRRLIFDRMTELGLDMRELSLKGAKRNHSYIQQYLFRDTPANLPEDIRERVAGMLNLDPNMLREMARRKDLGDDLSAVLKSTDADTLDPGELSKAIKYVLIRYSGELPKKSVDDAAQTACELYQSMSKVTNRRGAARIREALLPPLSNLLEDLFRQHPEADEAEAIASGIAKVYLAVRDVPASVLNEVL